MATMELSQVINGQTHTSIWTLDLFFVSGQLQHDRMVENITVSLLPSD